MRKIVVVAGALLCFFGCSNDNRIEINNNTPEPVLFNFRASEYWVPSDSSRTITEIPNGTYAVNIGTSLPPGATSWDVSPAGASFTFQKKSTKYLASFGATYINGVYSVTWNFSSTDPVGAVTITGPW